MDDFNDQKKRILHALSVVTDDIIDLPNYPLEVKTDLIIKQLYGVMRMLTGLSEKRG